MSSRRFSQLIKIFIFLLPLIYSWQFPNPYERPKFLFLVVSVWFLGLIKALELKRKNRRSSSFSKDKLIISAFIYLGVVFLADLFGLDIRTSILGSLFRHQGFVLLASGVFLFFLMRITKKNKKDIQSYYQTILFSGLIVSFFALWQGIRLFVFKDLTIPSYNGRIVGSMGNPNFLGGYLALVFPFVLSTEIRVFKKRLMGFNHWLRFLMVFFYLSAIFLSGSRGAILTIGGTAFIWLIYKIRTKEKLLRQIIWLLLFFLVLLVSLVFTQKKKSFFVRSSSVDNRFLIYQQGIRAVVKRPFLGYGQENFVLAVPLERKILADDPHNLFLNIVVSSGLLGLIAYVILFIQGLRKAPFEIKLFLISFLIRSQFNPLSIAEIGLFWVVLGFIPPLKVV